MILNQAFYEREPLIVAKDLLGKTLVHETHEGITSGIIVEAELYLGPEDKASHAFGNLLTERTKTQFGAKGHAYVYLIYGMYHCFNVTAGKVPGKPETIFFRSIDPVEGISLMKKRRPTAKGKIINLTNGPSKLCMAMGITKNQNGVNLCRLPLYIRDDGITVAETNVVTAERVGVDYAGEWKHKLWRFYIRDNPFVSTPVK